MADEESHHQLPSTPPRVVEVPDAASLEEFKNQVKIWIETTKSIRQLQAQTKERNQFKNQLTEKILAFMAKYNIDDLNTKDGLLQYKVAYVRTPLPQATLRERFENVLQQEVPNKCMELSMTVFSRESKPRPRLNLRKIKIS